MAAAAGRPSQCEPFRELILAKLDQQLSAQRIWQDLRGRARLHGQLRQREAVRAAAGRERRRCRSGGWSARRARKPRSTSAPARRSSAPDGKRRKTHVFRIVLSHSRKAYSEATFTQTTEDFFRCLENAFAHFGGVPKTLVIDNLKAAVAHPDWFDPELTPKVQSFCRHYGTVILPTKPYMPRHKGKVEAGVKYVQEQRPQRAARSPAWKSRTATWPTGNATVADTRIHGTTKRQVRQGLRGGRAGGAVAAAAGAVRHTSTKRRRKVNRDGHIEVAKAYYSVPPEYLGREVWVRWDARLVRIFNHRWEQIAVHVRHEPGRFSTHGQHLAPEKISGLERGADYLLEQGQRDRRRRRSSGPRRCCTPAASKGRACCKDCWRWPRSTPAKPWKKPAKPPFRTAASGCGRFASC